MSDESLNRALNTALRFAASRAAIHASDERAILQAWLERTADAERIAALEGEVERLRSAGEIFAKGLENAWIDIVDPQLSQLMCCNGWMCGCQGSTVGDYLAHALRAALKGTDNDTA